MEGYLPTRNLVFFNPGNPGIIYTHPAQCPITIPQLLTTQECLVQRTGNAVVYIEDRRATPRPPRGVLKDVLSDVRVTRGQR